MISVANEYVRLTISSVAAPHQTVRFDYLGAHIVSNDRLGDSFSAMLHGAIIHFAFGHGTIVTFLSNSLSVILQHDEILAHYWSLVLVAETWPARQAVDPLDQ